MQCRLRAERGIDAKSRVEVRSRFAAKTDIDTERQLVHKRVHAVFVFVSICCLLIAGAGYVRPLLLEPAWPATARPARAVTQVR